MEILIAIGFLYIILFITVLIKANFFSIIFLVSAFLFVILWLFLLNPYEIIAIIYLNILTNPWGLILLILPLVIIEILRRVRKKNSLKL
jgi:hypothetical protein